MFLSSVSSFLVWQTFSRRQRTLLLQTLLFAPTAFFFLCPADFTGFSGQTAGKVRVKMPVIGPPGIYPGGAPP